MRKRKEKEKEKITCNLLATSIASIPDDLKGLKSIINSWAHIPNKRISIKFRDYILLIWKKIK